MPASVNPSAVSLELGTRHHSLLVADIAAYSRQSPRNGMQRRIQLCAFVRSRRSRRRRSGWLAIVLFGTVDVRLIRLLSQPIRNKAEQARLALARGNAMIDAKLEAEQAALHIEHRELQAEQERLHAPPFDADAQAALTDRLRRHTARIRAYVEKLDAKGDATSD